MEEHIERNKRVLEQWERFHRQEPVDESAVRPLILRSWKRCRLQGVRPDNASKVSLSPAALEKLLDRNADLVAVAKSIMEKLYNPISTSRSFISLSDAQGIVLHALWDNTGSYPIPHLAPGNLAAESASGSVLPEEPTSMSSEPGLACWSKRCVRRLTGRMSDGYARLSAYWRVETKFRLSRQSG